MGLDMQICHNNKEIGYWHKCWNIHMWFVVNVQHKNDCNRYPITRENIIELLNTCKSVKEDMSLAPKLFPVIVGEVDMYEIDETIEILEGILKDNPDCKDITYCSAW